MKSSPPSFKVYNNIEKIREKQGLTQLVLAEKVGISRSNLYKIEHGQVVPSILTVLRIASYLGTNVNSLFALEKTVVKTEVEKFEEHLREIVRKAGKPVTTSSFPPALGRDTSR